MEHVQDLWGDRLTASGVQSPDGKATYVQLNLAGNQGTPLADESVAAVRDIVDRTPPPPGVKAYVTGPAPLASDMQHSGNRLHPEDHRGNRRDHLHDAAACLPLDRHRDSAVGHGWRRIAGGPRSCRVSRPTTRFLVLSTFAINMLVFAQHRGRNRLRDILLRALSRSASGRRGSETAYYTTYRGVAHVVLASGLTIAGAIFCLSFTRLPYFQTMGVPCAVGMLMAVAVAVTLVPAGIVVASRFGLFEPKRKICAFVDGAGSARRSSAGPRPSWPPRARSRWSVCWRCRVIKTSYNDRLYIPEDIPANVGYAAAERHFSQARMMPDILMVEADHDMRNPADFLVLNKLAKAVFRVPGISRVQGITRPEGTPIEHTSIPFLLSLQSAGQVQTMQFQQERINDMLKQADDMATMINFDAAARTM